MLDSHFIFIFLLGYEPIFINKAVNGLCLGFIKQEDLTVDERLWGGHSAPAPRMLISFVTEQNELLTGVYETEYQQTKLLFFFSRPTPIGRP